MTFLDRIKETSTSTGTGTFTLSGAVTGYKVFSNGTYKYCIVNDTETEWEVGEGTVASGVLTRTTIEASSNGGAAVSFSAGTKYVFNTVSAAYVNSLVPYTGATASVNLGTYGLTSDYLQLSTTPTATGAVGRMLWNDTDGTMDIGLKGGNVTLQIGQEQVVRVVNKVGATLLEANYQAVYISGAQGQRPKVALAQANADATSASTIGLVTETIADNQEGFITTSGIVRGINTTGSLQGETWADGDIVYLSPTTAGRITNVKPTAPNHTVVIGYVVHAHATQGKIFVKVDNGYEIGELHDVYAPSPATGNGLYWNATNSRYELNTIAGVLGYTPQAAITLTTTGTSGAATLIGNTLNIPQYAAGISGSGTAGQITYWSGTSAVTGSSNLFWDNANGRLGIGTSSPSVKLDVSGNTTTLNTAQFGTIGLQSYAVNNAWFGDNVYFNGTNFVRRSTGYATLFYFQQQEGQFRFGSTNNAGTNITDGMNGFGLVSFKVNLSGFVALGGNIHDSPNNYTGSKMLISGSTGNVMINTISDGGQRLQVIGSMRVGTTSASAMYWDDTNNRLGIGTSSPSASLHINNSINSENSIYIINSNTGTAAASSLIFGAAATGGTYGYLAYFNSSYTTSGLFIPRSTMLSGADTGGLTFLALNANAIIRFAAGGSTTAHMTIKSNGRINMSSLPTSATGLSAGDLWNNSGVINIV